MTDGAGRGFTVEVIYAMSLDGRISTADRDPWRWSDPADHAWLLDRMAAADLLVTGAGTIHAENPSVTLPETHAEARRAAGRGPQPARLILTPSLSVRPDQRFARAEAPLLIAARPERVAEAAADWDGTAELLPWDPVGGLAELLGTAAERAGGSRVLCLGGGRTNAAFLEEDLVDRISVTVCSFAIGAAEAPGPFSGRGFRPGNFPEFRVIQEKDAGRDRVLVFERDRSAPARAAQAGLD